jgi:hypothetical protein
MMLGNVRRTLGFWLTLAAFIALNGNLTCRAGAPAGDLEALHVRGTWALEANQPIGCGEAWFCTGQLVISESRVSWRSPNGVQECSAGYRIVKTFVGPSYPGGPVDDTASYAHFQLKLEQADCVGRMGQLQSLIVSFAEGANDLAHFAEFNAANVVQGWGIMHRVTVSTAPASP